MSAPAHKAVFLSYASQDAEAARRIADGLRAAGAEVWFDQNKLVGGDAWDAQIRRQIKECALFVPIISRSTQARPEGYFRLEWHLAEQRTLLMAHDQPFLLPVVIDETTDAAARVPEKFRAVQWTRLPGGETSATFEARVRSLLEQAAPDMPAVLRSASPAPAAADAGPGRAKLPMIAVAALGVLAIGVGVYFALRPLRREMVPGLASDKSVAVLPFANMSDDKDNAYFADGVHDDILTNIALIPGLRVVSRTTLAQYRDTKMPVRQIGETLHVAYILEGSVRGRQQKVRMSVQLINVRTDEPVWAKSFDRDLSDVFAIQSELAKEIAVAMRTAIAPIN